MRTEMANSLRAIIDDLGKGEISLAIDNSRIPAPELNELLGSIRSPWLGAAIDTATPLGIPQGYQISVRVLAHRALSLHLKDFAVMPGAHEMGFAIKGSPMGKGQLNIAWHMESL